MTRNTVTLAAGVKLAIFTTASLVVTATLAVIMGNIGFGPGEHYQAVFSSASMLEEGDDVRIAGVSVGEVGEVEHHERDKALVTFRVKGDVTLTTASRAEIRFKNLVGDRYLALEEGRDPGAETLEPGATMPMDRTSPSLDLTALFNGFQPLFQALDPDQVNELSQNLVQVLQGEGGTVQSLMQRTASLTNALADRDQLIGEVIENLNTTLETVDDRHGQLTELVDELEGWMQDLARDRAVIGGSLDDVSELTEVVAGFLEEGRPLVERDIAELRRLARTLSKPENEAVLVEMLDRLPESMSDQTRTGTYGSWYNYYLCGASARITLPMIGDVPGLKQLQSLINEFSLQSSAARCET